MTTTEQTIIQAGDNLFQLDQLVEAYGDILEQAKQQLVQWQPSDEEFRKISQNLPDRINYASLAYEVIEKITSDDASYRQNRVLDRLAETVHERINTLSIRQLIREQLEDIVNERFAELKRISERHIQNILDEDRREAQRRTCELESAFKTVFSHVLVDRLRDVVRREMAAEQQRQLNADAAANAN